MEIINLRVFRRNSNRTILLWSPKSAELKEIKAEGGKEIKFENIELANFKSSIPKDTTGIIVYHDINGINPFKNFKLNFYFNFNKENVEIERVLYGIKLDKAKKENIVYVYGYDYENEKWIPLPIDFSVYKSKK